MTIFPLACLLNQAGCQLTGGGSAHKRSSPYRLLVDFRFQYDVAQLEFLLHIVALPNNLETVALSSLVPADIYLFKVNNGDNRTICEICSRLTMQRAEKCQWRHFGIFLVNFEQISFIIAVVFPVFYFEQVNGGWGITPDLLTIFVVHSL